jgi:fluoride exporter
VLRVLIVFGAGGAGCVARYLIALAVGPRTFPWATLIVNLVGSFFLGLVIQLASTRAGFSEQGKLALTTGLLGGFTTYSSFNLETTTLVLDGHAARGLANVAATLMGAFAAGMLGWWIARRIAL